MAATDSDGDSPADSQAKLASQQEPKAKPKDALRKALKLVFLLAVCTGVVYLAYQPASLIDKEWFPFGTFQRGLFWFLRGTVVRSLLGALGVLWISSFVYWLRIRKQRFIVVSGFRVWGELADKFPKEGLTALLRDELMRLAQGTSDRPAMTSHRVTTSAEHESMDEHEARALFVEGGLSLPETHVTLQYEGISLEAFLTFVRRTTKREVIISGDLLEVSNGIILSARGTDDGPWEVFVEENNSDALRRGLQHLALRIMATLTERFQPKAAMAFSFLQIEASKLKDYELAFRLARLTFEAAPESAEARQNLTFAHMDLGVELIKDRELKKAILEFEKATELNPQLPDALDYLAKTLEADGQEEKAREASIQAAKIREAVAIRSNDRPPT